MNHKTFASSSNIISFNSFLANPKPPQGRMPSILHWAKYRIRALNFWSTVEINLITSQLLKGLMN
jgi:hypothetical protein